MRGVIPAVWRFGTTLSVPALRWMLHRRVGRGKEIAARLGEREGIERAARPAGVLLWLHAASVGEAVSMLPVLVRLRDVAPALTILFTTGTVTSATLLAERLPALGLSAVLHRFVPLDVPSWVARFLDHWRPDAAAFVESELWPNLLAACRRRAIPLALVNARMSARSFRQWRRVPGFARQMVGAFDVVHPQSAESAAHLRALGARAMAAPGNLKFAAPALPVDLAVLAALRDAIGARPLWLAASTHPGEEALVAGVHRTLAATYPDLLTIVAPRHPERGAAIAVEMDGAPRRALGEGPGAGGFWVADTMGEMGLLYALAPIVFMGRSLAGRGGQNPLEAARFGCAVAVGPHTANFEAIVARLLEAGGIARVADAAGLGRWVDAMLRDPAARAAVGGAGQRAAEGDGAVPDEVAALLLGLMRR